MRLEKIGEARWQTALPVVVRSCDKVFVLSAVGRF